MRVSIFVSVATLAGWLAVGLSGAARADGWYFSADTGINYVPTLSVPNTIAGANPTKVQTSLGMAILGAGGYAFGPVRIEEELGWRNNGVGTVTTPANGALPGTGYLEPLSAMTNVFYDIDTGSRFTPYLGAGLGGVDLTGKIAQGSNTITSDSKFAFGYQGIAGVAYSINDSLALKADYHYLATEATSLADSPAIGVGTAKETYAAHSVLVGFIYRFGASPPPMPEPAAAPAPAAAAPPPAPAPAAAPAVVAEPRQFMVFFDFDKSDITDEARKIIEQAATSAKRLGVARIDLTGHTDLAGPAAYNMALSIRRAEAVKKVLIGLGFTADEIAVVGKGKTDPLVPTADGVREPKNRRVVIVLPQ